MTLWSSSEPTAPPGGDGHSSELEDDEEEGSGGGEVGAPQMVPQTPDQEAFLKEHFVTLAERSSAGTASETEQCHCLPQHPPELHPLHNCAGVLREAQREPAKASDRAEAPHMVSYEGASATM